jgi:photosystem II stability/assembly factor-like uncharacterized protein
MLCQKTFIGLLLGFALPGWGAGTSIVPFQWSNPGPQHIVLGDGSIRSGKLQAFALSPLQPSTMYTGGGFGSGIEGPLNETGVLKSIDDGASWTRINNGLTDPTIDFLFVDPNNSNVILAGTEFGGMFRTADGGQTWTNVSQSAPVSTIISISTGILAGTGRGFELSTDGGATWTLIHATNSAVRCMAVGNGNIIAGLEGGDVIYKSAAGSTWPTVATNPGFSVWDIAIDPGDPRFAFYIRAQGPGPLAVQRTTDSGATWQTINAPTGIFSQAIAVRPSDRALMVAGQGMFYKSFDEGNTWVQLSAPWDSRRIVFPIPGTSSVVIGSDHGIHWTDNDGATWRDLSASISSNILFGVAVAGRTIFASAQDFGPLVTFDGGAHWSGADGAEAGGVAINPTNANYCYSFTLSGYAFSSDGCTTFKFPVGPAWDNYVSAANQNLIAIDPRTPSTLYVGAADGVWQSTDWGQTLTRSNWPVSQVTQVVLDPTDPLAIYVCTRQGFYETYDGGAHWTVATLPTQNAYPYSAAISPQNNAVILIALNLGAGRQGGGVLRSTDRGNTFQFVNVGLSTTAYNLGEEQLSISFNPDATMPVAALATVTGIYATTDTGDHWQDIRFNAVPKYFTQVVWQGGYLWAVTAGEGVLKAPISAFSVGPSSGTGAVQTFSGKYSATGGYQDLQWVQMLFSVATDGGGQAFCYVHYDVQGNRFWLYDDVRGFFVGPIAPGAGSNLLQGSLCALNTSGSSVSGSGSQLSVNASLVFKQALALNIYMRAYTLAGVDTGWVQQGTWTTAAAALGTMTVSPSSGSVTNGTQQTFTITFPDTPGFVGAASGWDQFLVGVASNGGGQPFCYVHYDRGGNGLWMYSSDVGFFLGPVTPGTSSSLLISSACSVNTAAATVQNISGNLVLNVPVTLKAPMVGSQKLFERSLTVLNVDTGFVQTGTLAVN